MERDEWEKKLVGKDSEVDCPLNYGMDENGNEIQIDGWLLPVLEHQRARDERNAFVTEPQLFYDFDGDDNAQAIDSSVLRCV